jgi:hypothetical protein
MKFAVEKGHKFDDFYCMLKITNMAAERNFEVMANKFQVEGMKYNCKMRNY